MKKAEDLCETLNILVGDKTRTDIFSTNTEYSIQSNDDGNVTLIHTLEDTNLSVFGYYMPEDVLYVAMTHFIIGVIKGKNI
jgi:hypothetical protein